MSCTVRIPSPLRSYTAGASTVAAEGETVEDLGVSKSKLYAVGGAFAAAAALLLLFQARALRRWLTRKR